MPDARSVLIEAVGRTEGSKEVEVRARVSGILEKIGKYNRAELDQPAQILETRVGLRARKAVQPRLQAQQLSARLLDRGVKINPSGPHRLRACTHLDVTQADLLRAADIVRECMESGISHANGSHLAGSAYASR